MVKFLWFQVIVRGIMIYFTINAKLIDVKVIMFFAVLFAHVSQYRSLINRLSYLLRLFFKVFMKRKIRLSKNARILNFKLLWLLWVELFLKEVFLKWFYKRSNFARFGPVSLRGQITCVTSLVVHMYVVYVYRYGRHWKGSKKRRISWKILRCRWSRMH